MHMVCEGILGVIEFPPGGTMDWGVSLLRFTSNNREQIQLSTPQTGVHCCIGATGYGSSYWLLSGLMIFMDREALGKKNINPHRGEVMMGGGGKCLRR